MLLKHILALVAFVPFVVSTQCKQGNFWWGDKKCCLPKGGPPNPPTPPTGIRCPKDTHYWRKDKDCCVPRQAEPKNPNPPKCPTNWEWKKHDCKCKPRPTPPNPPKPHPSPKSGYPKKDKDDRQKQKDKDGHHRRSITSRVTRCPSGLDACPISGLTGGYECFDTATELESCGGCVTLGHGQDCTKIEGAWNVACERGTCKVYSCEGGYRLDTNNSSCVSL